ncbi:MAG: hypothetical protein AAF871_17395 [Pseudomonadota bacterium]
MIKKDDAMRITALMSCALCLCLGACAADQGQGFDFYEVPVTPPPDLRAGDRIRMEGLPAVPRHDVTAAPTARSAAGVKPYGSAPEASVAATSVENTWLRVVDGGDQVWLVAERSSGPAPASDQIRSEAIQRSGCKIGGDPARVGRARIFPLDCS